jgi:hypothetical protein
MLHKRLLAASSTAAVRGARVGRLRAPAAMRAPPRAAGCGRGHARPARAAWRARLWHHRRCSPRATRHTPDATLPRRRACTQRGVGGLRGEAAALSAASAPSALAGSAQALAAGPTSGGAGVRRYAAAGAPTAPYSFTPPGRHHLFVPGPSNIADRVMRVMARQSGACARAGCRATAPRRTTPPPASADRAAPGGGQRTTVTHTSRTSPTRCCPT